MSKEMAQALKRFHDHLGLTQEELGEKIGATRPQVAQWEIGRSEPSRKFDSRLRDLGFSLSEEDWPLIIRLRGTRNQMRLLIALLADEHADPEMRETARQELLKALSL